MDLTVTEGHATHAQLSIHRCGWGRPTGSQGTDLTWRALTKGSRIVEKTYTDTYGAQF